MPAAVGADALLGLSLNDPSDIYAAGHPSLVPATLASPPDTPTAALASPAAPGNINNGVHGYAVCNYTAVNSSQPSTIVYVTVTDKTTNGQVEMTFAAGPAGTVGRKIYRTIAGGTALLLLTDIADNTTLDFTDNVADGSLGAAVPDVASNYGFKFLRQVSHSGGPKVDMIDLAELDGFPGMSRQIQGMSSVPFTLNGIVQAGAAVFAHAAQWGTPAVSTPTTGVKQYDWVPRTSLALPRDLTALWYKGNTSVGPRILYNLFATKQVLAVQAGQVIKDTVTFAGIHHGISGVASVIAGCSGYLGTVVARGRRFDAARATDALYIKVTTPPSAGTFKVKFKVGSGGSYSGAEWTIYYDTGSSRQTRGGSQMTDWVEAYSEAGVKLGSDTCTLRAPYEIMFTGDVSGLLTNDELAIPVSCLIPGTGAAPYTGTAPSFVNDCRLNWADAQVSVGGTNVRSIKSFNLAFDVPWKPDLVLGSRVPEDMRRSGKYGAVLSFSRDLLDDTYDDSQWQDARVTAIVTLQGPLIGATAYRKSIQYTFSQLSVVAESDVPNSEVLPESIVLTNENTDAGADGLAIRILTDQVYTFNS